MMAVHESDVKRAMKILHFICDEGGIECYNGACPLHEMCRGYMQDDDTSPFMILDDPDVIDSLIDTMEANGLIAKG